jgi:hypothetical protein
MIKHPLAPEHARPPERYPDGSRPPARPWTPAEDLALFAALVYCENRRDYDACCQILLCDVLGRRPVRGKTANPNDRYWLLTKCITNVQQRVVTNVFRGVPAGRAVVAALPADVWPRQRDRITWAEAHRFWWPWWKKRNDPGAPTEGEVRRLVGRWRVDTDHPDVDGVLQILAAHGKLLDVGTFVRRHPLMYDTNKMTGAVRRFVERFHGPDDGAEWVRLHQFMAGRA